MRRITHSLLLILLAGIVSAQELIGSYMYAQRDTCDLYLDIYKPVPDTSSVAKPTILFIFGGGFITGTRNDKYYLPWFKMLTDEGYGVVSVDYRLGLKGKEMKFDLFHLIKSAKLTKEAVDAGVEDVFSAVRYLSDNQETLGIDPGNIVLAGSSAGAMISLSCIWENCTPTVRTAILPEGFSFKGAMSFAGAVMSTSGLPKYQTPPPPQLLFHGDKDGAVAYDKIAFGRFGIYGSNSLVEKVFSKQGYNYAIYRYINHTHDIAAQFFSTWPEQKLFLERNVIQGLDRTIDSTVDDPSIPNWKSVSLNDIY